MLKKWMDRIAVRAMVKAQAWKRNEEGMEIIQVLILLGIGVGLVAVFIAFSDQIIGVVGKKLDEFLAMFSR